MAAKLLTILLNALVDSEKSDDKVMKETLVIEILWSKGDEYGPKVQPLLVF